MPKTTTTITATTTAVCSLVLKEEIILSLLLKKIQVSMRIKDDFSTIITWQSANIHIFSSDQEENKTSCLICCECNKKSNCEFALDIHSAYKWKNYQGIACTCLSAITFSYTSITKKQSTCDPS